MSESNGLPGKSNESPDINICFENTKEVKPKKAGRPPGNGSKRKLSSIIVPQQAIGHPNNPKDAVIAEDSQSCVCDGNRDINDDASIDKPISIEVKYYSRPLDLRNLGSIVYADINLNYNRGTNTAMKLFESRSKMTIEKAEGDPITLADIKADLQKRFTISKGRDFDDAQFELGLVNIETKSIPVPTQKNAKNQFSHVEVIGDHFVYSGLDCFSIILIPKVPVAIALPAAVPGPTITGNPRKKPKKLTDTGELQPLTFAELRALADVSKDQTITVNFILGAIRFDGKVLASRSPADTHNACR